MRRQWAVGPGEDSSITDVDVSADRLLPLVAGVAAWLLLCLVQACCAALVLDVLGSEASGHGVSVRDAGRRLVRRPAPAVVYLIFGLVLLSLWCVSFVAASQEDLGVRDSFARSRDLTRTRRLKSTLLALVLLYSATLCGPVVGGLLLLLTSWPVAVCNTVAAACTALLVPIPTIGVGLLFYDLRQESAAGAVATGRDPDASRIRASATEVRD